jgi:alanyl-tRNA synthetase
VGIEAFRCLAKERALVFGLSDLVKVQPPQIPNRVAKLVAQLKTAEKHIADLKSSCALADVGAIVASRHDLWGVGRFAHRADGVTGNDLRTLAHKVHNRVAHEPAVVAVVGGPPDKPSVVIVTAEGARNRGLKAGELVRTASETLGGCGGGKDDIAQGGGSDGARVDDALKAVEYAIGHALQA